MKQETISLSSKQMRRLENKKRKMSALCRISKLNEEDKWKSMLKTDNSLQEENFGTKKIKLDNFGNQASDNSLQYKNSEAEKVQLENLSNEVRGQPEIVRQKLTEDEVKALRILIRKRFAAKKNLPKLRLKEAGDQASVDNPKERKIPLFLSDVQHFILYSLHGHMSTGNIPRWAIVEKFANIKNILFLVVEGMSCNDYKNYESLCPELKEFPHKLEVITPLAYGGCLIRELATLPLTESQRHKLEKKFGSIGEASSSNKVFKILRTMFPMSIRNKNNNESKNSKKYSFPKTELLLSPWQMLEEGYPIALEGELKTKYANFVYTKDKYEEVTPNSPMWALDCEMCQTKEGSELTRISIVNENLESVYESLVKPYNPIVNYLTRFSGITPKLLENVEVRLEDVQKTLREIIPPDLILIGHSLGSDLQALRMLHPYCIDTSVLFNLSGERMRKTKLKVLSAEFLGERIQCGSSGHDSIEDSRACMKLVQEKLKHCMEWGDAVIAGPHSVERIIAEKRLLHKVSKPSSDSTTEQSSENIMDSKEIATQLPIIKEKQSLPKFVVGEDVVQVQMFTTSVFSHLVTRAKTSLLVGKSMIINEFIKYMPEELRVFQPESRMKVSEQPTNKAIIKFGRNNAVDSGVTMMFTSVEKSPKNTALKVNKLVKKLTKYLSGNTLIAVLLAGRNTAFDELDTSNHGLLLLNLHQETVPPIRLERDIINANTVS